MKKIFWILFLTVYTLYGEQYNHTIVVMESAAKSTSADDPIKYWNQRFAQQPSISKLIDQYGVKISAGKLHGQYIAKLGPIVKNSDYIKLYQTIHQTFPATLMIEEKIPSSTSTTDAAADTNDHKPSETAWMIIAVMVISGLIYMIISFMQLRRIKKEHAKIEERQYKFEDIQQQVLTQMSDNIHALAQQSVNTTKSLAHKARGVLPKDDIEEVVNGGNEIMGITSDLIKFLQIKSGKIRIRMEPFDFNNVLHEVAGTIYGYCGANNSELVFDIAETVPKMVYTDSLHMTQVLTNMIEYLMCDSSGVRVHIDVASPDHKTSEYALSLQINSEVVLSSDEMLFDARYDDVAKKYVGLNLYVAKKLIYLMGGSYEIESDSDSGTTLKMIYPMKSLPADDSDIELDRSSIATKKILVCDADDDVMTAMKHFFAYFGLSVDFVSSDQFDSKIPYLGQYDILFLDSVLLDSVVIGSLELVKSQKTIHVISLENLFASSVSRMGKTVDIHMQKPITRQNIYDVLTQILEHDKRVSEGKIGELEVYRGDFDDKSFVTLKSFARFAGAHIMLVEDDVVNQNVLKGVFSHAGLTLLIANNGQEALDMLETEWEQIDMILMDINMPVMDGFTATRLIHADSRYEHIPIVTLTALVSEREIEKMFDSGINGYLSKPLRIGRLYSAMERFMPQFEDIVLHDIKSPYENGETDINELDVKHALSSLKNNVLLYQEVLSEFKNIYDKSDTVVEKLIRDHSYDHLRTLCVDLRGLTGTIGAQGLYDVVSDMLAKVTYDPSELTGADALAYSEELERLNKSISKYLRQVV